jgi:hypothetical protein
MAVFWYVAPCSLVDIDRLFVVLTAPIIRAMSKPGAEKLGQIYEQVGLGRSLPRAMGARGGSAWGQTEHLSQWEQRVPQTGQKEDHGGSKKLWNVGQ